MDKFEYRVRTEQMLEYLEKKSYKKAMEIADSIDWRKVKNAAMLCSVSEIYEFNGEYQKSRDILFIAYDRSPGSRKIIYRLGTLALKIGDIEEAADCHEEFVKIAPKDPNQFILHFKILRAQKAPINQQIEVLESFKKAEYVEKWAYELARLYHEAGMTNECIEECDDLILWFSEGKYVYQAMELKMKYKPLTSMQKEKYEKQKLESLHKPMFRQEEEVIQKQDAAEDGGELEEEPDESAGDTKVLPKIDVKDLVDGAARDASTLKTTVSGATFAEALENGVAVASGRVPAGTSQPRAVSSIRQEPEKEVKPPKKAETAEEKGPVVTGQMKIDEILKEWEEKQRENAAVIQEKQKEVKAQRETETISVKPETASLVSEEILELIEDLESDEEPVIGQDLELEEKYRDLPVEEPEEDLENMGSIVEALQLNEEQQKQSDAGEYDEYEEADDEYEEYEEEYEEYEEAEEEAYEEYEEVDEEAYDEYEEADEEEYEEYEEAEEEAYEEYEEIDEEEYEEYEDAEEEYDEYKDADSMAAALTEEKPEESDDLSDLEDFFESEAKPRKKKAPKEKKAEEPLEIEEPSAEEIEDRLNRSKGGVSFDTGFVVQGRYDLSATSEIGLKVGLTEEQKKLFSYFVPIRGVSEQIVEVLENDKRSKKRYGTSRTGNILVIGRKGTGKTVLAVDLVKAIQKQRKVKQGRVAIVTGEALNKKELGGIVSKLSGGAMIIEKAGKLNTRTIRELNELMENQTGELLVILEEQRKPLEKMLAANPEFKKKFTSKIELPVFINDELVTFGQTYAKENGYKIDDMGILALYSRIDVMQREDHAVTVAEVKEIMDEAIDHSQKANVKHLVKRVFGKSTDEGERVILTEEDFKN